MRQEDSLIIKMVAHALSVIKEQAERVRIFIRDTNAQVYNDECKMCTYVKSLWIAPTKTCTRKQFVVSMCRRIA